MQKCPSCSSINEDRDTTCGVCGADLSKARKIDEDSLDQIHTTKAAPVQRKLNKTALLAVLTGPVLTLLGFILAFNILGLGSDILSFAGIGLLLAGLFTTTFMISIGPSFRAWWRYRTRYRWGRGGGFPAGYGSHDPRPKEVEEEEAREAQPQEEAEDYQTGEERKKDRFD